MILFKSNNGTLRIFSFQEKNWEYIYFGWKHREDPSSSFVLVEGVENGGGIRRVPYDDITKTQLLERAQQIFFPNGKNSSLQTVELENCDVGLGNFAGEPFTEKESFESTLSDYLTRHGLFASKVKFYLLTTKKNSPSEAVKGVSKNEDLRERVSHSKSLISMSGSIDTSLSQSLTSRLETPQFQKNVHDAVLYVDDSRRKLNAEFRRVVTSEYSQELSAVFVSGWSNCYACRSPEFLDKTEDEYHPCDDSFAISNLTVDEQVYIEPLIDSDGKPDSDAFIQSYVSPAAQQILDKPAILFGPDVVYGYEGNELFLAVVTNFHNEIGVMYEWSHDDTTVLRGAFHALMKVSNPGTYSCKIWYGDHMLSSNCVVVHAKRDPEMPSSVSSSKAEKVER